MRGGPVSVLGADISKAVGHIVNLSCAKLSLLVFLDFVITQTAVNFLNVMSWRGVWELHGIWIKELIEAYQLLPIEVYLATCSLSAILNMVFCGISPSIDRLLLGLRPVNRFLISRLYTVVFFVNYMLFWSSFWNFFPMAMKLKTDLSLVTVGALSIFVLLVSCCFNTVNGVPASVVVDTGKNYCTTTTLLRDVDLSSCSPMAKATWRLFDVLATTLMEVLGILVWFAVYNLAVENLPDAEQLGSSLLALLFPIGLGIFIMIFGCILQMVTICCVETRREEGERVKRRRLAQFAITWLGLLSSIFFWAGGWNLIDAYFYKDQPLVSAVLSALIGVVGMMAMGVSRSLHGGICKDGLEEEAYPLQHYYLLALFTWESPRGLLQDEEVRSYGTVGFEDQV